MKQTTTEKRAPRGSKLPRLPRNKDLMTCRDVSARSGIGLTAIYGEIRAGRLAARQVGNRAYVSRPGYEAWLANFGREAQL
jgi:hypothetical protein